MSTTALGISSYYHDSAAAVVEGGHIVAAAQQERFSRHRHDAGFPALAVASCLAEAGRKLDDVDVIAYYEDPRLKFSRVLATYLATAPRAWRSFRHSMPEWLGWKLRTLGVVREELARLDLGAVPPIRHFRHHESHAASAFLPSPYESAAVLCVDGVGEWATTTLWHGRDRRVEPLRELRFPHSLGLLYSAFTYFCGFKVDSGEYKLMGLAPYGRPVYAPLIREKLVDIRPDGSFRLDTGYFEFLYGQVMTGRRFAELFGGPRREPEGPLTEREFDLAASVQLVTEEIMLNLAAAAREHTGERHLCLAGGVALNCVANGKLVESGLFDEIWVQPAAGDAGGALGAALLAANGPRDHLGSGGDGMQGARLGPGYDDDRIQDHLDAQALPYRRLATDELRSTVAGLLADGKVVGWFQGRMEFGPRALGGRSILGDARNAEMQSTMNLKIKFRESFRPFAPIVLAEHAGEYFDLRQDSPYMLIVAQVAERRRLRQAGTEHLRGLDLLRVRRSQIPAVTHVDHSARVQTVARDTDPDLHGLLTEFHARTGCPVLVNTSFNVRGEPIVATPEDAYRCFMRTDIDALAIGSFLLLKSDQPPWHEDTDWRGRIPLD
ncbi:carbamoyltransferase family protein [Streptomyces lancefieldiae]|uniref:Carbamoyltransferase n=1 Tax=Streptomyces lancefieldiae TaxID=3075520 RepID=A0ABU3AWQ0_9ACTN|nr:carbamoyltransferase [Streptomyces sp. DSM 40712]MDT0614621.1 carbamoyltransferase [Streptomyces sp. DSM 40712]